MRESNVSKTIQLTLSKLRLSTLFRNNTGQAWVGEVLRRDANTVTLTNYRPLHAGLTKGSSDLIGWSIVEVTPEMVGKKLAVFTAIEVKSASGRVKPEQLNFIKQVRDSGGISGIARKDDEAVNLVQNQLNK